MTTVSSGRITTHAFDLRRDIGGNGGRAERDAQAERQAATGSGGADQKARRSILRGLSIMALLMTTSSLRRRQRRGSPRAPAIGAAAADIGDRAIDIPRRSASDCLEQGRRRHDHAALAIAALRHVGDRATPVYLVQRAVGREPLDRGDRLTATALTGTEQERVRHAGDMYGAGAALAMPQPLLGAGQADRIAQHPKQGRARIDIRLIGLSVDVEGRHTSLLSAA